MNNAIEATVRSLARNIVESKFALQLLLELSRSNLVRDLVGNVQGCIFLLVTISCSDDIGAAKDAKELLENLSFLDQNVIQMAKANYFRPLLHLLSSGTILMICFLILSAIRFITRYSGSLMGLVIFNIIFFSF